MKLAQQRKILVDGFSLAMPLAVTLAILLKLGVLKLEMSGADFATFSSNRLVAVLLGIVAGISEKAVSVRVIERAGKIFAPGST